MFLDFFKVMLDLLALLFVRLRSSDVPILALGIIFPTLGLVLNTLVVVAITIISTSVVIFT